MKERILSEIEPKEVFRHFEDLTRIPRESGKEQQVTDHLIRFAVEHGLEWQRDEFLNVVIRKKAASGYEDRPGVILQAHSDMVCEKNSNVAHDFYRDPLPLLVSEDRISAVGTTLGADNGLGVALAMAILADHDARHPALEFLCTSDEERGMTGAIQFDFSQLTGKYLLNLDGSDMGVLVIGCAGGPGVQTELKGERLTKDAGWVEMRLAIKGLTGGHSGEDIHRGRASAIKLLGRLLATVERTSELRLCQISGGQKYNAIPREAEATISLPKDKAETARLEVERLVQQIKKEYRITESGLDVSITLEGEADQRIGRELLPLDPKTTQAVLDFINLCQNGVVRMDPEFGDLVESSVSLGIVRTEGDLVTFQSLTRSSMESIYDELYFGIKRLARRVGAKTSIISDCPEWSYDPNSELRRVCQNVYRDMFASEPQVLVLHAGLECGVFYKSAGRYLDIVAMGPDIRDLHAPGEYIIISSVQRFWEYFNQVLSAI